MFLAMKEKRFAKRAVRRLLKSHSAVSAEKPELTGKALYREVLLHTQQVDPSRVDQVLLQAGDSYDDWSDRDRDGLVFRQVVHCFVMSQYLEAGHKGTVVRLLTVNDRLLLAALTRSDSGRSKPTVRPNTSRFRLFVRISLVNMD